MSEIGFYLTPNVAALERLWWRQLVGVVRASPTHTVRYSGSLFYGAGSVGAVLPVRCPEIRDVRYSGVFNVHNYSEFRRDMKTRPLFGICPLFGVSVKREFTVVLILTGFSVCSV